MFLDNKYLKWYMRLVSKQEQNCYTEVHHIIPRSMGGTNSKDNLVPLSLKAHLVAHHLLTKITSGGDLRKMLYAYRAMSNLNIHGKRTKITTRQYAFIRQSLRGLPVSDQQRLNMRNAQLGKVLSEEHRKKIGDGGRGKKRTLETRQNISESLLGREFSIEHRANISKGRIGQSLSNETKNKLSKSMSGRSWNDEHCLLISKGLEKFRYTLVSPEGQTFITDNLKSFSASIGIPYTSLNPMSKIGGTHKSGWVINIRETKEPKIYDAIDQRRHDLRTARRTSLVRRQEA